MSRVIQPRWTGRTRRQARAALRLCAAFWLVLYIAYTPIHLYLEPHSDGADVSASAAPTHPGDFVAGDGHDGDEHHERHPAAQHKFKVTQPTRAVIAQMVQVQAVEPVDTDHVRPQPQVFGFSGLSPPGFSCSWQFFFRTALPVRAPSLLS